MFQYEINMNLLVIKKTGLFQAKSQRTSDKKMRIYTFSNDKYSIDNKCYIYHC